MSLLRASAGGHNIDQGSVCVFGLANDRRRYKVTASFIGWAHYQNEPCWWYELTMSLRIPFNTLRSEQNSRHLADDIFKCVFVNENFWISNQMSLIYVPHGIIHNTSVMALRLTVNKPFPVPMLAKMPGALWHDDVIKWKHFPRYWPFVRGIHRSPVNSPHKGQWRGALMFFLSASE